MAGFSLKSNLNEVEYRKVRVASQAYTIGDAVMKDTTSDSVDVIPATSSTTHENILGVAMETVISSATSLLIAIIEPSQKWECAVTNTVSANHNYQNMVLTDKATVNNTGTDSVADTAIVEQVGVAGAKGLFIFRGDST
jgi:hypothetical protein